MAGRVLSFRGFRLRVGHQDSFNPILASNTILLLTQAVVLWFTPDLTNLRANEALLNISPNNSFWAGLVTGLAIISVSARLFKGVSLMGGSLFICWWVFFGLNWIVNAPAGMGGYFCLVWAFNFGWVITKSYRRQNYPELVNDGD